MDKYQYFSCTANENCDKSIKKGDQYQEPSGKWRAFTDFIGHPMGAWLLTDTIRRPIKFTSCRDCRHYEEGLDGKCNGCMYYMTLHNFEQKA
jgi:hypothetical protein